MRQEKEVKGRVIEESKIFEPTPEGIAEFRKSAIYQPARKAVEQAVKINNQIHDILASAKDRKNPIYSDEQFAMIDRGVKVRPIYRVPTDDLRNISYSSSLIGGIHQIVSDDVSMYCQYQKDPGYKFELKDPNEKIDGKLQLEMDELGKMLLIMGDKSSHDWRERNRMHEVLEMATRDTLAVDEVCYLRTYNAFGKLIDVRYLDPGTMFKVDPRKGYSGDKRITHVQMIRGRVIETFEAGRIVLRNKNNLSDVRMNGFGFSPIEQCLIEIMSLLFTIKHNADRFNSRNPPKVLLTAENNISKADQERLELEWENAYYGGRDSFKVPMLFGSGKMQVHNLDVSDDFEFDKVLQMSSSLIIAAHGMDAAQLGLKLYQSTALSEPSTDGRQHFARDRMHGAIMGFHQDCLNELIDPPDDLPFRLVFTGVKTEDLSKKADLSDKEFKTFKSLDELRKERDLPTMKEEADEYLRLGIFSEEEAKAHAKLGALRGNQYYAQAFTKTITPPVQQQIPGQEMGGGQGLPAPAGGSMNSDGLEDLPWNEEDFGEFDNGA
ncbi:phage portal protein [Leptospira sp. GIMC2001]|uniref:phage portal protein n=1 Tax=Leptospira sp. GIMC2001 TaxID=1513297 RepID=UPI002349810C|nr:phage portal protein [Leptospira sp. GIMC2001]WCL51495.1 phage portal protein [Leptospira sp. GIMC2001]